jgi:hypothetical protein
MINLKRAYKKLCYVAVDFVEKSFNCKVKELKLKKLKSSFQIWTYAISCASKPLSSWTTQQVIQECREACGGNGYLKASRLGDRYYFNSSVGCWIRFHFQMIFYRFY